MGDQLIWEYSWWYRSWGGIWLIFVVGYFYWFAAINIMLGMKTLQEQAHLRRGDLRRAHIPERAGRPPRFPLLSHRLCNEVGSELES